MFGFMMKNFSKYKWIKRERGGWIGLLAQVVTTAIQTAATDYVPVARDVNKNIFLALPFGKYNTKFNLDQKDKIKRKKLSKIISGL